MLDEYSPRPSSAVYVLHWARKVVTVHAAKLIPWAVGMFYGFASMCVVSPYVTGTFERRFTTNLTAAIVAAGFAAMGTSALWGKIGARVRLLLESHPQSQATIVAGYRLPPVPKFDAPAILLGECHPTRVYDSNGSYTLDFNVDEAYSPTPELVTLPALSLVTGLLVFGSIGSGKTAYVLRPAVFQLFHHPSHPGGLVMDSKAALVEPLLAEMEAAGRLEDLRCIGPNQPTRWNPLHQPQASPATIANALLTTLENVNGAPYSADTRWIRSGAASLAEGAIGLLRLLAGYVTAASIRVFLSVLQQRTAGSDTPGAEAAKYLTELFSGSLAPTEHQEEFSFYSRLIIDRMGEDEKFRAIYLSELFNLLVPLTAPSVAHLYNAPAVELDMPDWVECINRGLVVVLDCNAREVPGLAIILGMMLKLSYEDAMISRISWAKQEKCNAERYMALVIDEYQDFASPGDTDYQALCREALSITVFLTQGFASIVQRVGDERAKVLLQSMRNRLVLNQSTPEFSADLLGQHDAVLIERNISESVENAALTTSGKFGGESTVAQSYSVRRDRRHVVPPEMLASLPLGQGILQSHDGKRVMPLHRVYLRPYYVEPGTRYVDHSGKPI